MKRLFSYIFAGVGAAATLWGAYYVVTGLSEKILIGGFNAMFVGLAGIALLTIGLLGTRD